MTTQKRTVLFRIILLIIFLSLLIFITVHYYSRIVATISNPDMFRNLLVSYGPLSILIFICFQIFLVILAPLPSELLLIAGGYIFGTLFGAIYSLIGILTGSIIVFGISKFFGSTLIKLLVSPKRYARLSSLVNNQKSDLAIFFLYLVPEIPKDLLTYTAGLTPVDPLKFIVFSTIARFPCVIGSSYIGANLRQKNYLPVIILLIAAGILLVAGFANRKKIINKLNNILNHSKFCKDDPK